MDPSRPSVKEAVVALRAGEKFWKIPPVRDAEERLRHVAKLVVEDHEKLDMDVWFGTRTGAREPDADFSKIAHTCGTTACVAGWAILLAGEDGKALLEAIQEQDEPDAEEYAGRILLGEEAREHFFDADDEALEYLQSVLEES